MLTSNRGLLIPRIIHQIYEDPVGPPEYLLNMATTWKRYHPAWEYRFWNRLAIQQLMKTHFPKLLPSYRDFPLDVQRWDAIRYLVLYQYGGLYVDMDYECMEPLDSLLHNATCCIGLEPKAHASTYAMSFIVGNALIASIPRHPFLKKVIDAVFSIKKECLPVSGMQVLKTTGPFMITRLYNSYPCKKEITLLPACQIAPLAIEEIQAWFQGKEQVMIENKIEQAFAIHYFLGSWHTQFK